MRQRENKGAAERRRRWREEVEDRLEFVSVKHTQVWRGCHLHIKASHTHIKVIHPHASTLDSPGAPEGWRVGGSASVDCSGADDDFMALRLCLFEAVLPTENSFQPTLTCSCAVLQHPN